MRKEIPMFHGTLMNTNIFSYPRPSNLYPVLGLKCVLFIQEPNLYSIMNELIHMILIATYPYMAKPADPL